MTEPDAGPVTVAVVDNHEAVRLGVAATLARESSAFQEAGSFADVEGLLSSPSPPPDIVVLDLYLGRDDVSSVAWIETLVHRGSRVLLHTSEEAPVPLRAAMTAGASGLALKNDGTDALMTTLREVAAGDFSCSSVLADALLNDETLTARLTPRELEVLRGLEEGLSRKQVAARLGIGQGTVSTYLNSVRKKFLALGRDISNVQSVVSHAVRDGHVARRPMRPGGPQAGAAAADDAERR